MNTYYNNIVIIYVFKYNLKYKCLLHKTANDQSFRCEIITQN